MRSYKFKKLTKHDPQIKFSFQGTTENMNFLMRVTGVGTSYIVLFMNSKPYKILKGCQDEIIHAYENLMNGEEIEVISQMIKPSQRDLETFCRV